MYHNRIQIVILKVSELSIDCGMNCEFTWIFLRLISDATNDSYSVSQTQTINFTQQTLRQRQAQQPNAQQAPQSQSQQQSQLGMQMNMNAQNSGENRANS